MTRACEWCGGEFTRTAYPGSNPLPRFCGNRCSASWRMSRPEYVRKLVTSRSREASAQNARKASSSPKFREYVESERNPFRSLSPESRAKAHAKLAAQGWPNLRGGNGTGPTIPQASLHRLLSTEAGWELEIVIRTGQPKGSGYPPAYKADIGNRALMTAIEVHGKGHGASGTAGDWKKRRLLESLGWTVLWFQNREILSDPCGTLRRVREITSPITS